MKLNAIKNVSKKLAFISFTVLFIWLFRVVIFRLLHIDFASIEITRGVRNMWCFLIPLAMLNLILNSWNIKTSDFTKAIGLIFSVIIMPCIMLVHSFLLDFCVLRYAYVKYEHKTKNLIIQNRFIDCGATTSGEPYELVITRNLGKYFIKYKIIGEEEINIEEWNKK